MMGLLGENLIMVEKHLEFLGQVLTGPCPVLFKNVLLKHSYTPSFCGYFSTIVA
jgi:hypothetical protein